MNSFFKINFLLSKKALLFFCLFTGLLTAIAQVPTITNVNPKSGNPGTSITITGTGFVNGSTTNNVVYFGSVKAAVTAATATSMTVTVPSSASNGKLSYLNSTALKGCTSDIQFSTTFAGASGFNVSTNFTEVTQSIAPVKTTNDAASSFGVIPSPIINHGDFNLDGKVDLVIATGIGTTTAYGANVYQNGSTGNGNFTFATPLNLASNSSIEAVAVGDITLDGKLDVVMASPTTDTNSLVVFRNTSSISTISFATGLNINAANVDFIDIRDINNDGRPDIIFKTTANDKIHVSLNSTTNSSSPSFDPPLVLITTSNMGFEIGDVNNDGFPDIMVATSAARPKYYVNNGSGAFPTLTFTTAAGNTFGNYGAYVGNANLIDVDGDGLIDFAGRTDVNSFSRNTTSGGVLSFANTSGVSCDGCGFRSTATIDMDGDGDIDLVGGAPYTPPRMQINRSTSTSGTISFLPYDELWLSSTGKTMTGTAVDLDNNGRPEFIQINGPSTTSSTLSIIRNKVGEGPTIISPNTLSAFTACAGSVSSNQSFSVSGQYLTANISVTPPTGFEISLTSGGTYQTTALTLTQTGGIVNATNIFVRTTTSATGTPSGNITLTSTGATTVNEAVTATINALPSITGTISISSGTSQLTGSGTANASNPWISSNTAVATVNSTGLVTAVSAGTSTITYTANTGCSITATFTVTMPTITTTGTLSSYSACSGLNSSNQSFSVSGSNLSANIIITPPTGYEISLTSGGTYQTTALTLTQSGGTVNTTNIFVRTTTLATGSPSGNITLTSTGATQKNISVTGTITPSSFGGTITGAAVVCSGTNSTTLTLSGNTGTIQWQSSTNNSTFSNIASQTSSIYTAANLSATTYYRVVVTSGSCASVNSTSVKMEVAVTPVVTNKTATICSGETFSVAPTTGSGNTVPSGTKYTWTVASNANVSGETAESSLQNTISQTLTNTSTSTQTVVYTVTPKNTGTYSVGSPYNGGVIAYIFQPTDNGYAPGKVLIVKGGFVPSSTSCTDFPGWLMENPTATTSALLGEGLNNTNNLFAAGHTSTNRAIGYIHGYSDGTYSDWFAPSIDELTAIFTNVFSSLPTTTQTQRAFRSSTRTSTNAGQTDAIRKTDNISAYTTSPQNDGGCGMVLLSRYDTLPSTTCDGATFTVTVTVNNNTWLGTTSTAWNTASNWSCGSAPTASSNVVIASSSNQPVIGSNVSINSLTINSGTTLTVNSGFNLTVANAVANSGTMTLQNNANLLQDTAATTNSNTGSITVNRNSSSILRLDHTLWSSPVASQNLYNFSPATLTNRFYVYDTAANVYSTSGLSASTIFAGGKGYAVRAPNDHSSTTPATWTGTFTGVPNNGTVPYTLVTGGSGYNLVGNPYPSSINATSFLTENTGKIAGTLYFYAHSLTMNSDGTFPAGTNYSSWNTTAAVAATTAAAGDFHPIPVTPNGVIQVGQGFFVKATASGDINFTNAMRVNNNADQFLRTNEIERHRLWLNLTTDSDNDINQIAVAYVEGATNGVDSNFDGLSFGNTVSWLSSKINTDDYVIQGRSLPFDSNDVVALGFKVGSVGNYKIKLTNKDGLFLGNQDVFVRDNLMGIEHNIKVSPYLFASQAGTFDNRFQLVYTQRLATPTETFTTNSVLVTNNPDGFHVTTNGIVMKDIHVYDISGRLLFKQLNINGTATDLKMFSQANQVLLLKITSQENVTVTVKAIN